jgi:hypothetical protein
MTRKPGCCFTPADKFHRSCWQIPLPAEQAQQLLAAVQSEQYLHIVTYAWVVKVSSQFRSSGDLGKC